MHLYLFLIFRVCVTVSVYTSLIVAHFFSFVYIKCIHYKKNFYFSLLHCSNYVLLLHTFFLLLLPFIHFVSFYRFYIHTKCIVVALAHFFHIFISFRVLSFVQDAFFLHSFKAAYKAKNCTWEKRDRNAKEWWAKELRGKKRKHQQYHAQAMPCHAMPCQATTPLGLVCSFIR